VKEATITKSKKGTAGPEFNEEHAHWFFLFGMKGIARCEFVPPNTTANSDFYSYCDVLRRLRKNV
jgi:hypothetical protein